MNCGKAKPVLFGTGFPNSRAVFLTWLALQFWKIMGNHREAAVQAEVEG